MKLPPLFDSFSFDSDSNFLDPRGPEDPRNSFSTLFPTLPKFGPEGPKNSSGGIEGSQQLCPSSDHFLCVLFFAFFVPPPSVPFLLETLPLHAVHWSASPHCGDSLRNFSLSCCLYRLLSMYLLRVCFICYFYVACLSRTARPRVARHPRETRVLQSPTDETLPFLGPQNSSVSSRQENQYLYFGRFIPCPVLPFLGCSGLAKKTVFVERIKTLENTTEKNTHFSKEIPGSKSTKESKQSRKGRTMPQNCGSARQRERSKVPKPEVPHKVHSSQKNTKHINFLFRITFQLHNFFLKLTSRKLHYYTYFRL